ncbi:MAG: hypothetical protein ACKO7N_00980 [Candidatus Nitrosotenuis sp.]
MTGTANFRFTPADNNAIITIKFGNMLPDGFILQIPADNSMGYGAEIGDYVTVQCYSASNINNYKYLIIGTGMPRTFS